MVPPMLPMLKMTPVAAARLLLPVTFDASYAHIVEISTNVKMTRKNMP